MRLIDADAIKIIPPYGTGMTFARGAIYVLDKIAEMPTIDPVKRGKWLPHPTEPDWDVCSVCGLGTHRRFHYNDAIYGGYDVEESFAYCPNCGAQMERSEE